MESAAEAGSDGRADTETSSSGSNDILQFSETQDNNFMLLAMHVKSESCCMGTFGVKLVKQIFSSEYLQNRNCRGSQVRRS